MSGFDKSKYLPTLYKDIVPSRVNEFTSIEFDKCTNCIMICGDEPRYNPQTKCCTYFPFVANYLVGSIIKHNSYGFKVIRGLKKKNHVFTPMGLSPTASYQKKFDEEGDAGFGKKEGMRCPFYKDGGCGIWDQRSGICIGFQCYSSLGSDGLMMWERLGLVLNDLEYDTSKEIMRRLGFSVEIIEKNYKFARECSLDFLDMQSQDISRELWGSYFENEEEFYLKAFDVSLGVLDISRFKQQPSYKWFKHNLEG